LALQNREFALTASAAGRQRIRKHIRGCPAHKSADEQHDQTVPAKA
jgi:hypothetical protein